MTQSLQRIFILPAATLLLSVSSCRQETSSNPDAELVHLRREYMMLQQEHQKLLTTITELKQDMEVIEAGFNSESVRDREIEKQLSETQTKLINQQKEYQALQKDYQALKDSIAPLDAKLKASILALHKELVGIKLGTVVLKSGRQLHNCEVAEVNTDSVRLNFIDGSTIVPFTDLPPSLQKRFFSEPLPIAPSALLAESPPVSKAPTKSIDPRALIQEAFAERHRQELAQYKSSLQKKIPELESKIASAELRIKSLRRDRTNTQKKYSQKSGSIRKSPVDRDKALEKIDSEIRKLEIYIDTAAIQIESWRKELKEQAGNDK